MTATLTLVRGAPPNVASRGLPGPSSDDPAARRRELRVVLELCAAQARGARERAAIGSNETDRTPAETRDSRNRIGTPVARLGRTGRWRPTVEKCDAAAVRLPAPIR